MIFSDATKLIKRHQRYLANLDAEIKRRRVRSGRRQQKVNQTPAYWAIDMGFDPYHVRKHSKTIAYTMKNALKSGDYSPKEALKYSVPKADGQERIVSVFQVADSAISRMIYKSILSRNARRLSPFCYAYREDIGIHDAILNISNSMKGLDRIYVAEYDFRDFFGSISHEYIEERLRSDRYQITTDEQRIIMEFLRAPVTSISDYGSTPKTQNSRGIPLGTSVSLFVANLATSSLADRLSRLGVEFAIYSDDSLVWSDDYNSIARAANIITESALEMGVTVNLNKSEAISLISPNPRRAEIKAKDSIPFVGYHINSKNIFINDSGVTRAKKRISSYVYFNLVHDLKMGRIPRGRVTQRLDRDYLVMLSQIRRFLYGNLDESKIAQFNAGAVPKRSFQGFMSFYPIVNDLNQLKQLDAWLVQTVFKALKKRTELLRSMGRTILPLPHGLSKENLIDPGIIISPGVG